MATSVPVHEIQSARAKTLQQDVRVTNRTPEQTVRNAAADILRTARGGKTQGRIGEVVGLPQQHVSQCEDPDDARSMTVVQLVRAAGKCPSYVAAVARGLLALTEAPAIAGDLCERVCAAMAEGGDVARVVLQAWADRRIDADERDDVVREIDEAIEALQRLRADVVAHAKGG